MTAEPCRCDGPNTECRRSGKPMVGRLWELCSGTNCSAELSERYRAAWDGLPIPPRTTVPKRRRHLCSAGTHLSRLLLKFGITYSPGCKCQSMAAKMDRLGCDWCESEAGMAEIIATMRQEAENRGLPFLEAAARLLVRRAVKNARKTLDQDKATPPH